MSLIRNPARALRLRSGMALPAMVACLIASGCANKPNPPATETELSPVSEAMYADGAMVQRDWSASIAYYPTGATQAYSTHWPYEGQETNIQELNAVVDPVIFLTQTVMLPVRVVLDPPGKFTNYYGPVVPPSYTAMPPLPPEPGLQNEPQPVKHRRPQPVQHKPYRPFGAVRDWWGGIFSHPASKTPTPTPKISRPRLVPTQPAVTEPTSEPSTNEPSTEPTTHTTDTQQAQ